MKCVISGSNIKILAKAIHALAKIGDEMYVQPQEDSISFRAVSMANSAYADFTMFKNYFSYYTYGNLQDEDALRCKISMRCAMGVFKAPHVMDKVLETCHIKLEPNASKLFFILKYKNSIIKTHRLPIIDCETLKASYKKDGVPNQLTTQAKVLLEVTQNFQQNLIEITLEVTPQKVLIRNYIDETPNLSSVTRTQIVLGVGEFDKYTIGSDTSITFCLKELRALLGFAETVNLPISVNFETAGRPVVFVLKSPSFEANLVLSTLNPDVDSQSDISQPVKPNPKKKTAPKRAPKRTTKTSIRPAPNSTIKSKNTVNNRASEVRINPSQNKNQEEDDRISANTSVNDISVKDLHLDENYMRYVPNVKPSSTGFESNSPSSSSTAAKNKDIVQNIFPPISKRKSNPGESNQRNEDDIIPCSPPPQPSKKARLIFQKCFKATFDPRMLPGHDQILAEDSDDEK